ncbi:MAG: sulfotransferase family protein [Hypericibacter sp.]
MASIARAAVDKGFDFLVVGAQKSGTTAIHEYLCHHPAIAMPAGKEAPFFSNDECFRRGFDAFRKEHFSEARPDQVWGKVSPQYMTSEAIVDRVARSVPQAKIIAILRDPVERARSHYKMALRRGWETRSIDTAFAAALEPAALATARSLPAAPSSEAQCYLAWGEYGRILGYYRTRYPGDSILILFNEHLSSDPAATIDRVLEFVGLSPGYRPANLGESIFAGGGALRFPGLKPTLKRLGADAIMTLLSSPVRHRLRLAYKQFNERPTRRTSLPIQPSKEIEERLAEFYLGDVALLEQTFRVNAPWPRFGAVTKGPP